MDAYLVALPNAAMPAPGNLGGGVLAELVPVSRRTWRLAIHAATA